MTEDYTNSTHEAARLIQRARYAVALTGAGMSTRSGIPDFRSPGTGLWEKVDPMEVASIFAFRRHPEAFYGWLRPLARLVHDAAPNPGHVAMAELGAVGFLKAIVTQNIDNLHQQAGSEVVVEVHGHLREATCIECYHVEATDSLLQDFLASGQLPRCSRCGGIMKPNAVLFGEQLPMGVLNQARAHADAADLMLIAGSSLEVFPVCRLPSRVCRRAGRLIVINLTPTPFDDAAEVVIHADVADVLPLIVCACQRHPD